ncbi:putative killer cell immunoglobulin-like receptor-like protein KIR3DX1 [Trichechus manatus latirostris]|uniref:Killer cell immunoglobulin-like receptor-like protein KIR3DX1 n=1 Tax=Trichechus manatus latirostris TaxID=127582 RepID=A0A2Y9R9F1_TRIMA|nr:putative killer cell immunoglobulin-like receptor-like protein KIR3DX1 [Trichechus manatus latirostris]
MFRILQRYIPVWSAYSNTLEIVVTGVFTKPAIWAHPSSLMNSGGNVTLNCSSELVFDKYNLHKEGNSQYSQQLSKKLRTSNSWADFSMEPITPALAETYRCCGFHSHSPYEWSAPSPPVELMVTGTPTCTCLSPTETSTKTGPSSKRTRGGYLCPVEPLDPHTEKSHTNFPESQVLIT